MPVVNECPVPSAKPKTRLWAMVTAALARIGLPKQSSGAAQTPFALPLRKADGGPQMRLPLDVIIHRRAMRQGNRNPDAVALYVHRHTILSKGVCSNGCR